MANNRKKEIYIIAEKTVSILDSFGVKVKPIQINDHRDYMVLEVELSSGIKLSNVVGLSDELALYLGVDNIVINPVKGKPMVLGIKIPLNNVDSFKENMASDKQMIFSSASAHRLNVLCGDCDYIDSVNLGISTIDKKFSGFKTRELLTMNVRDIATFFICIDGDIYDSEALLFKELFSINMTAEQTAQFIKKNYNDLISHATREQISQRIPLILQIFVKADNSLMTQYHRDLHDFLISVIKDVCFSDHAISQSESTLWNQFALGLSRYIKQNYKPHNLDTWNDRLITEAQDIITKRIISTSYELQTALGISKNRALNIVNNLSAMDILQCNDNGSFSTVEAYMISTASDEAPISSDAEIRQNDTMQELNALIGLQEVKREVTSLINTVKMRKIREAKGLRLPAMSNHLVFYGNPGTGKTTVARLLAKVYCQLGMLSKGHLVEAERSDLVAGYVGQTAIKTKEVIEKAKGGILFIDEAYTLCGKSDTDYGKEAVDTLLKNMEDNRADLIVIVAGYKEPMDEFLSMNPGLRSRFNKFIGFEDYSADELYDIFNSLCKSYDYILDHDVETHVRAHFINILSNKPVNFSNGRFVRNYFEHIIENQSNRLACLGNYTDADLKQIKIEDL